MIDSFSFLFRLSARIHMGQKSGDLYKNDRRPRQDANDRLARDLSHTLHKRHRSVFSRSARPMVQSRFVQKRSEIVNSFSLLLFKYLY